MPIGSTCTVAGSLPAFTPSIPSLEPFSPTTVMLRPVARAAITAPRAEGSL